MASAAEQLASNLNFGAFAKADELKKRIWFTLGALIIYRLGTYIPLPGMNPDAVADLFKQTQTGVLGLFLEPPQAAGGGADEGLVAKLMELVIEIRANARKGKDFATADLVRNRLGEAGIVLEDRPDGTGWSRK